MFVPSSTDPARPTRRDLLRWGAAASLGAGALSAADLIPASAAPGGSGIRIALESDPPNMDPHRSTAAVDRQVYQNLYDKLVDTDENLRIVPMLATSWTVSPDGKTYTFKLQQGVKFHDGTPFNAQAVKYNFDRMRDPKFPSTRRSELGPVIGAEAVDAYTVRVTLERPYSPLMYVLTDRAGMMVSPAAAQKDGLNFALHPVGTGPFRFTGIPPYWARARPNSAASPTGRSSTTTPGSPASSRATPTSSTRRRCRRSRRSRKRPRRAAPGSASSRKGRSPTTGSGST